MRKLLFIFAAVLLSSIGLHAGNTITYTASAQLENIGLIEGSTTFGPAITSHTFSNGKGTITCSGEITTIGRAAFCNCTGLTQIEIPSSVTTIEEDAFSNSGLTSVIIPSIVTTIEGDAFRMCRSLAWVIIPSSVKKIERQAFADCSSLRSVTVNWTDAQSIVSIISNVFEGIANGVGPQGATLYVPAGTVDLYKQADVWKEFEGITAPSYDMITYTASAELSGAQFNTGATTFGSAITIHTFSNGKGFIICAGLITKIADGAFTHSGITSITLPPSITQIGKGAFEYCGQLQSIILPSSLSVIGDAAFQYTGLTSITIPASVERIDSWAFQECPNLKEVIIPSSSRLTSIGSYAFSNCSNLTSIIIPNSVTKIGERAFWGCGLTSVTIPASVKEIGFVAFKNCTQLKDLQFAERKDVIDIGSYVFENTALAAIDIPDWMKEIPEGLFYLNSKLEAIYLSAFVQKINQKSFGGCTNLKYIVNVSETPPELAEGAFEGYDKDDKVIVYVPTPEETMAYRSSKWGEYFTNFYSYITYRQTSSNTVEVIDALPINGKVEIPAMFAAAGTFYKVTGIRDNALKDKDSLVSISLPPTIQYIGNSVFSGCKKLKDINIEFIEDLQTIGDSAFYNCTALESIVIPEGVQSFGKAAFMECKNVTSVSLPAGLKIIPNDCFRHCYNLKNDLIIPEGVDTIGVYAFNTDTALKKVYLPSTLKELRYGAFAGTALREVFCPATTPPTLVGATFNVPEDSSLYVYVSNRDLLSTYKNSQWESKAGCPIIFKDLMAEENKAYLYQVADTNKTAQKIAKLYCDSIDKATTTLQVQRYTDIALEKIDALTLKDYKQALVDSLNRYAKDNAEAMQIADQYAPQIINATSRPVAEQLFAGAYMKITDIYELIDLKNDYKKQLNNLAGGDIDLQKVATDYGALIDRAETKEQARALYERATMRININKQIKSDWNGGSVRVNNHTCTTTKGY